MTLCPSPLWLAACIMSDVIINGFPVLICIRNYVTVCKCECESV